jgi:hypothetical protein
MTNPTEEGQQSIELAPGTVVYGSKNLEIGVTEGGDNGYVEFETAVGEEFRLTTSRLEVEQFAETLSQRSKPLPAPPEGAPDEIDAPDGWTAGTRHTGGGIWCIIFEKQIETGGEIEVLTDAARPAGVSAGCYDEEGAWVGELTHEDFESADYEKALGTARDLISKIEDGEFEETIAELLE